MNYKKITSFEEACKDLGRDPAGLPDYSKCGMTPEEVAFNLAVFQLATIARSVNKDEDGDEWNPAPTDQRWTPWGWIEDGTDRPSGLGLSFVVSVFDDRHTVVASRLCFRDSKRAEWAFEAHKELYCKILIFQG